MNCPFCGAIKGPDDIYYQCGSRPETPNMVGVRGIKCRDYQIATLQAKLAECKAQLTKPILEWLAEREQHIIAIRMLGEEKAELRAQLADRDKRLDLWNKAKGYIIWNIRYGGKEHVDALKAKGEI